MVRSNVPPPATSSLHAPQPRRTGTHRPRHGLPGRIWSSQQGLGIAKDVWLAGIGGGLLADGITRDRPTSRVRGG